MSKMARKVMEGFYRDAKGDPTRLPWHDEELSPFLTKIVADGGGGRRALDVGCGSGVLAARLAELGFEVTAIDLLPGAVEMALEQVERRGVDVVQADILEYAPERPFELVFDSGCLHSLIGPGVLAYRAQLLRWLAPGGDFVLGHWGKRHSFDWRPIGPRRRTPTQLAEAFAPDLELVDSQFEDTRVPLPFGPTVRMATYWFRRAAS